MAEEENPVYYEDLAKLEAEFDEIDTEISAYTPANILQKAVAN